MNTIRKVICCIVLMLTIAVSVIGCNTMEGAGKDIERGGERIQDAAD